MYYYGIPEGSSLAHAGKKGMKWGYNAGRRNGKRIAAAALGLVDPLTGYRIDGFTRAMEKMSPAFKRFRRANGLATMISRDTKLSYIQARKGLAKINKVLNTIDRHSHTPLKNIKRDWKRAIRRRKIKKMLGPIGYWA